MPEDDTQIQSKKTEMQQLRYEKAAFARKSTRVRKKAVPQSEGEGYLLKKERELRRRFVEVQKDKKNAEVLYRYGFFLMDHGEYSSAIRKFEEALKVNGRKNCTFPLEKAQMLKAHMFIGYCAGQLLKHSLANADRLNVEDVMFDYDLKVEGKSLENVMQMLKNESEQYVAFHNSQKQVISLNEYLQFKAGRKGEVVLISFVEADAFIKVGQNDLEKIPSQSAGLLRFMLEIIIEKGYVTYDDVRFDYGTTQSWDTLRRNVNRINQLAETHQNEIQPKIFELTKGTFSTKYPQSYQLATTNYIIVFRQSEFAE